MSYSVCSLHYKAVSFRPHPRHTPTVIINFVMADQVVQTVRTLLKESDVQFIRLTWCDTANVTRAKALHVRTFESIVKEGFGLCTAVQVSSYWVWFEVWS